ncbi:hypothetical protein MMC20_004633 [Loxospora ochrophaea]|nr:hypothetical protein [Loxospora ochrophaea]
MGSKNQKDKFEALRLLDHLSTIAVNGAIGLPIQFATVKEIETALKLFVAAPILWGVTTCVIKLSVLSFYRDIFQNSTFKKACIVMMALTGALLIAVILGTCLLCRPFAFAWDKTIPGGHCGDATKNYLAIGIVNMIIDFSIVALPMPILWKLQMPFEKKMAVSGILSLGLLVSVFSVLRIPAILHISELDFTGTVLLDTVWGALEILLGVVTACLPLLQPPLARTVGKDSALRSLLRNISYGRRSTWNSGGRSSPLGSQGSRTQIKDIPKDRGDQPFRRLDNDSLELNEV